MKRKKLIGTVDASRNGEMEYLERQDGVDRGETEKPSARAARHGL